MPTLHQYEIYCETESAWIKTTGYQSSAPSTCPTDPDHTVSGTLDPNIVSTLSDDVVRVDSENEDARPLVAPAVFPNWVYMHYTSQGDDFDAGIRGDGQALCKTLVDGDPVKTNVEFRFVDPVFIVGGFLKSDSQNIADYVELSVKAPATEVSINESNTGNCTLVNIVIGNMIAPALGNGTHDVDITSPINANLSGATVAIGGPVLVTKAVPVPSYASDNVTPNGYWDWNRLTGAITPNYTGTGRYNLLNFEVDLVKFIHHWFVWTGANDNKGSVELEKHEFQITQKGQMVLPHWKWVATLTRDNSHDSGVAAVQRITVGSTTANQTDGTLIIKHRNGTDLQDPKYLHYLQTCCILPAGTTSVAAKSIIEASIPFVNAGGVTATVSADIGDKDGCTIDIEFTEVGIRSIIQTECTLTDTVNNEIAISNSSHSTIGVNISPDTHYVWACYIGRAKTPVIFGGL